MCPRLVVRLFRIRIIFQNRHNFPGTKRGRNMARIGIRVATVCLALTELVAAAAKAAPGDILLVLNKGDNALALVDPASGKVTAKIPTGVGPHEIVASTDGKFAFVTNYGDREPGSTLSMID